jgi:hypothetical protein
MTTNKNPASGNGAASEKGGAMADDKESARGNGTKPKKAPTFAKVPISLVSDQTFDDNESRKDPHLAKIFHGTLAEHTEALAQTSRPHRWLKIPRDVTRPCPSWAV